jgi:hypothetical protein
MGVIPGMKQLAAAERMIPPGGQAVLIWSSGDRLHGGTAWRAKEREGRGARVVAMLGASGEWVHLYTTTQQDSRGIATEEEACG